MCSGSYTDFDGDGNCTTSCGANLLNGTATSGSATVVSYTTTGGYSTNNYIGGSCSGRHDASAVLCDAAPWAGSPSVYQNSYPRSGARWYTFGNVGEGILVIDAGSAITFNTLEMFQHYRFYSNSLSSPASSVRYSVHASTTTAPSASDPGWVTLTAGFDAVPSGERLGTTMIKPGVWNGSNQTSRFIRIEIKGTGYRTGFQGLKGFICN
jgi:hypothetical protein